MNTVATGAPGRTPATWSTPREALHLWLSPRIVRRTLTIAFAVGLLLSLVNQLHVFLNDEVSTGTWIRIAANFVIPYMVSSLGVLTATRAPRG